MGLFGKRKPALPRITWHVPEGTQDFLIPRRATPGAMAFDMIAPTNMTLKAFDEFGVGSLLINTLVAVTLPPGYALLLGPRSGLAAKHNITVEAGWIDNDYRGMIRVLLYNHASTSHKIEAGDRIAQAMLVKICNVDEHVEWTYPDPEETSRGSGGFGSTGK